MCDQSNFLYYTFKMTTQLASGRGDAQLSLQLPYLNLSAPSATLTAPCTIHPKQTYLISFYSVQDGDRDAP